MTKQKKEKKKAKREKQLQQKNALPSVSPDRPWWMKHFIETGSMPSRPEKGPEKV